jgi:hypothetical protein
MLAVVERPRAGRALRRLSLRRLAAADAALNAESFKALVADFDRSWPSGVTRTRDVVSQVEERGAS